MVLPNSKGNKAPFGGNKGTTPSGNAPKPSMGSGAGLAGFFSDIDFENTETAGGRLEPGWYEMYVESIEPGMSSNQNPQLIFTLQAVEDEDGNNASGRPKYFLTKTPKTWWKIKSDLQALGVEEEEMATVQNADLVNRFVRVLMGPANNDATKIVANELAASRKYQGQKFSPAKRGVPGQ